MAKIVTKQFPSLCKLLSSGGKISNLKFPSTTEVLKREWQDKPYKSLAKHPEMFAIFFGASENDDFSLLINLRNFASILDCMLAPKTPPGLLGKSRNSTKIKTKAAKSYAAASLPRKVKISKKSVKQILKDRNINQFPEYKKDLLEVVRLLNSIEQNMNELVKREETLIQPISKFFTSFLNSGKSPNKVVELLQSAITDLRKRDFELNRISLFTKRAYRNKYWVNHSFKRWVEAQDFSEDQFMPWDYYELFE